MDGMNLNQLNGYGVPLHACNGYVQDEHYWAWVRHLVNTKGLRNVQPSDVHPNREEE